MPKPMMPGMPKMPGMSGRPTPMPMQAHGGMAGGPLLGGAGAGAPSYGANASPQGHGWGQQFMQQYGSPPGQMRDQWSEFRTQNGMGGGQPPMPPMTPPTPMGAGGPPQAFPGQGGGIPPEILAMLRARFPGFHPFRMGEMT